MWRGQSQRRRRVSTKAVDFFIALSGSADFSADVVVGVRRDVASWPERRLLDGREQRCYFGLKTAEGRVIEFECRSQREHDLWTNGVERLLAI